MLDRYFRHQAIQDLRKKAAAVFVLINEPEDSVLGYYTLSSFTIDAGELPDEISKRLPRYSALPATLIGRLAVDGGHQGRGIGEFLLLDALRRSWENTRTVGSVAVLVDAIDEKACCFYRRYDFIPFRNAKNRLFLPMASINELFALAEE
jgi:GNAT superfamily N-acetyltransferase